MKDLYIKRLRTLANHMARLSVRQIKMDKFFNACGTPACVLGHATNIESFNEAGLRVTGADLGAGFLGVGFRGENGEYAGGKFFGLRPHEAISFFGMSGRAYGTNRPTPKLVAKRIREFVKEKSLPK